MTMAQLERRISNLEEKVKAIEPPPPTSAEAWLADAGRFANDPIFDEIVRLGREYRESLRPKKKRKRGGNGRLRH